MQEEAEEADPPTYRLPNGIGGFQAVMMTESVIQDERRGPNVPGSHGQKHNLRGSNVLEGLTVSPQHGPLPPYPLHPSQLPYSHPMMMHITPALSYIAHFTKSEKMMSPKGGDPFSGHTNSGNYGQRKHREQEDEDVTSLSLTSFSSCACEESEGEDADVCMRQQAQYVQYMHHMMYQQYLAHYYSQTKWEEMSSDEEAGGAPYCRREKKDPGIDNQRKGRTRQPNYTKLADDGNKAEITQDELLQVVTSYAEVHPDVQPPAKQLFMFKGPRTYQQKSNVLNLQPEQHDIMYALASCYDVRNSAAKVKKEVRNMLEHLYIISPMQFALWFKNRYRPKHEVELRKSMRKQRKKRSMASSSITNFQASYGQDVKAREQMSPTIPARTA